MTHIEKKNKIEKSAEANREPKEREEIRMKQYNIECDSVIHKTPLFQHITTIIIITIRYKDPVQQDHHRILVLEIK